MLDEIKFLKKRGQRTKYLPEFCDQLVEHMSSGFSFDSFKAVTGSSLVAMYDWVDRYPDWAYAKEQGNAARLLYLEQKLMEAACGGRNQVPAIVHALKNVGNGMAWEGCAPIQGKTRVSTEDADGKGITITFESVADSDFEP